VLQTISQAICLNIRYPNQIGLSNRGSSSKDCTENYRVISTAAAKTIFQNLMDILVGQSFLEKCLNKSSLNLTIKSMKLISSKLV